ncbi:MAG: hypothetical protein Salg2KO_17200 [Salibacteraceae bacterium]
MGQKTSYCSKYKTVSPENRLTIEDKRSDSLDIIHTAISLDLTDVSNQQISGNATLTIKAVMSGVNSIDLDFEGLDVDSIFFDGQSVAYHHLDSVLRVEFPAAPAQNEEFEVQVFYHGSPIKDASGWGGFYFSGNFAWNLGVGFADDPHSYGRIWFPCFDNFIEKSTFEYYLTVNDDRVASANGLLLSESNNNDGTTTYHWKLDQPISSYLACVAVAPYIKVEGMINGENGPIPYQIFGRINDSTKIVSSFTHLDEAVLAFEKAYGPYRFDKVGYSLVPFNSGAMEHATNITYPIYAVNGGLGQEELMAHELAHMWWGDNVTCQTDGDMWINEGWASFSEYLFLEEIYDRDRYENAMKADLREVLQFAHHREEMYRPVSGQPHEYVYGDHVYKKGALVAHNLRGYMGDEAFFDAIGLFMEQFKYSAVSSDSLERWFQLYSGQDLSSFFRDWVFTPGFNVVVLDSFRVSPNTAGYEVDLFLKQKLKGRSEFHDDVPVYYTIYDASWNEISGITHCSGSSEKQTIQSAIEPHYISLYGRNELAQARTVDRMVVSQTGNLDLPNMMWDVSVESVTDSSMVWFEHIWSAPDILKDFETKPYRLSNYHYWRVTGLDLDNLEMSGDFFYDGREGGNTGYMDMDLVSIQEDSLILLYRESTAADWEEYEFYTKNTAGPSDNAFGIIELEKIVEGEYTLANFDHTVLGMNQYEVRNKVVVFPNPARSELTVDISRMDLTGVAVFTLTDTKGAEVLQVELLSNLHKVNTSMLSSGIYNYIVSDGSKSDSGKVVISK